MTMMKLEFFSALYAPSPSSFAGIKEKLNFENVYAAIASNTLHTQPSNEDERSSRERERKREKGKSIKIFYRSEECNFNFHAFLRGKSNFRRPNMPNVLTVVLLHIEQRRAEHGIAIYFEHFPISA
jgi:hypothetical protein